MLEIIINSDNYNKCVQFCQNMWANEKRPSVYNKGMLNSKSDPYKTERVGLLGEMAFALYMGVDPYFEYVKYGKPYDFIINGYTIDVKTASKYPDYEATLLMCLNEYGKPVNLKCDIYISSYIKDDTGNDAIVCIVGWHEKSDIIEQSPVRARRNNASHMNYELKFSDAKSIDLLKEKLYGKTT